MLEKLFHARCDVDGCTSLSDGLGSIAYARQWLNLNRWHIRGQKMTEAKFVCQICFDRVLAKDEPQ